MVFLGRYLPGFNSGGPVRTISCMVEALAPYFDFYIVTLNRDSGSRVVYENVRTGAWNTVGLAQVFYTPRFTPPEMRRIADELLPDAIYFNGFFSTSSILGMLRRRVGGFRNVPAILATRGDLAGGALGLKAPKKRLYLGLARLVGLYRNLLWHASSEREKNEMLRVLKAFGVREDNIHVAPDLGFGYQPGAPIRPKKIAGEARFVTISRVTRMKNLLFTLDQFASLAGKISLDVFGPLEDGELWAECERKIASLPANVRVEYRGAVDPAEVIGELATRHFFILPTLGENYGHVIIEGAAAGCPIVISDRTQWLNLAEKQVGWDVALENLGKWHAILQHCVDMNEEEFQQMSTRAAEFGQSMMNSKENLAANIELFRRAIAVGTSGAAEEIAAGATK